MGFFLAVVIMGDDIVKLDPNSLKETMRNSKVWRILCQGGLDKFTCIYKGHDEQISMEVANSWYEGRCNVNSLEFMINPHTISQDILLLNEGIQIKREGKVKKLEARYKFLQKVMRKKKVKQISNWGDKNFDSKTI